MFRCPGWLQKLKYYELFSERELNVNEHVSTGIIIVNEAKCEKSEI